MASIAIHATPIVLCTHGIRCHLWHPLPFDAVRLSHRPPKQAVRLSYRPPEQNSAPFAPAPEADTCACRTGPQRPAMASTAIRGIHGQLSPVDQHQSACCEPDSPSPEENHGAALRVLPIDSGTCASARNSSTPGNRIAAEFIARLGLRLFAAQRIVQIGTRCLILQRIYSIYCHHRRTAHGTSCRSRCAMRCHLPQHRPRCTVHCARNQF